MLNRGIKGLPTLCLRACVVTDNRGQKSARLVDHNWIKTATGIKQHYILPNQSFAISHHVSKAKYGVNYTIYCAIEIRKYSQRLVVSCENTGDLWDIPWYTPRKRCITSIYYSFQIFPRFWLVKTTRIIHHNQILNQWRQKCSPPKIVEPMTSKWRQECSPLQIIAPLTEKTWGQGCVTFGEWKNK